MNNRVLWILLFPFLLQSIGNGKDVERTRAEVRNVKIKVTEVARDGDYEIFPQERFRKVDVNSTIRMDFETPQLPDEIESSPRWNQLTAILDQLALNSKEYKELAERASRLIANDAPLNSDFVAQVDAFNVKARDVIKMLVVPDPTTGESILSPDEFNDAMAAGFEDPYGTIANVLNEKREVLHETAGQLIKDADKFEIVLRAFLLPEHGGRQALHVPGYDELPQGDFNQANPLAVLPSPKETERLMAELDAARTAAASVKEIRENGQAILESMQEAIPQLRENVTQLVETLRSDLLNNLPSNWKSVTSEPFVTSVANVQTADGAADQLSAALGGFGEDLQKLETVIKNLELFRTQINALTKPGGVPFTHLQETISTVNTISSDISDLTQRLQFWPDQISEIKRTTPAVVSSAADNTLKANLDEFQNNLNETINIAVRDLSQKFPQTKEIIEMVTGFYKNSDRLLELGADEPPYIPHPLDELQPAELDLRYTGIIEGDRVEMTFEMRPKDIQQSDAGKSRRWVTYEAEATFAGWHRRFDSNLILSRPFNVTGSNALSPNTSVSLEFHRFTRPGSNWFWNKLDFGFGFHAAFLDQDVNENIEMGGGVNISILDGLLRTGVGYNISAAKDNEYWFVGFGLFSVLNKLGEVGKAVF